MEKQCVMPLLPRVMLDACASGVNGAMDMDLTSRHLQSIASFLCAASRVTAHRGGTTSVQWLTLASVLSVSEVVQH